MYIHYRHNRKKLIIEGNVPFEEIWETLDSYTSLKKTCQIATGVRLEILCSKETNSATIGVICMIVQDLIDSDLDVELVRGDGAVRNLFDTMIKCCNKQKKVDHIQLCA